MSAVFKAQSKEEKMGLDFSKAKQSEASVVTDTAVEGETLPATTQTFDIAVESEKLRNDLVNSAEVDALVSKIELDNLDSIVTFGGEVATEISKSSDLVLNSMNIAQIEETSKMLGVLANIMSKFDIEEIKQDPGLFDKLFGGIKKQLDKIMAKYQTMGGEIDKIYVELKGYEGEIKETNKKLNTMFDSNTMICLSIFWQASRVVKSLKGLLRIKQPRWSAQVISPYSLSLPLLTMRL